MDVLVTYDVNTQVPAGKRRLRLVVRACEGFGQRVQNSVFEVQCTETALVELTARLARIIDQSVDSIRIYRLDSGSLVRVVLMGTQRAIPVDDAWVL
ncbi:MAG: CRISPR-associated endonuclease Cas2 [Propionibacteriaceae bacterium]|jgi:CRISPR-associated protein Cas2|nr:CRISPR-associated endonuclease Cas2 [Propionibacteriaceae bacterium]